MSISNVAIKEFKTLARDIFKELRKEKSVTKGKELRLLIFSDKNLEQIVRSDSEISSSLIAEAKIYVNEGVYITVNEPEAYISIETVCKNYEGKFTEILLKTTYKEKTEKE